MRVVLDTNVFISGIFWEKGACGEIIHAWKQHRFLLVTSLPIVEELMKVLKEFKIKMSNDLMKEWRTMILQNALVVVPSQKLNVVEGDPDDNKFFEAATAGKAECLVSQDKLVLKIGQYRNVKVVSPRQFLERIKK